MPMTAGHESEMAVDYIWFYSVDHAPGVANGIATLFKRKFELEFVEKGFPRKARENSVKRKLRGILPVLTKNRCGTAGVEYELIVYPVFCYREKTVGEMEHVHGVVVPLVRVRLFK